jgi:3-deoxy-7-phosphoheptulonate synthase
MSRAAVAAGADGLIIEVHRNPDKAKSDGGQTLFPEQFTELMTGVRLVAEALGTKVQTNALALQGV